MFAKGAPWQLTARPATRPSPLGSCAMLFYIPVAPQRSCSRAASYPLCSSPPTRTRRFASHRSCSRWGSPPIRSSAPSPLSSIRSGHTDQGRPSRYPLQPSSSRSRSACSPSQQQTALPIRPCAAARRPAATGFRSIVRQPRARRFRRAWSLTSSCFLSLSA